MPRGPTIALFLLIIAIFIGFGDKFLPKPLSTVSLQTRNSLNQTIVGLFPSWRPKTKPNQRTEDAIKRQEQQLKQ
jgi:hypothetical protein